MQVVRASTCIRTFRVCPPSQVLPGPANWREAKKAEEPNAGPWEAILNHPGFAAAPPQFRVAALRDGARSFFRTYQAGQHVSDLDQALANWRQALELVPGDSPECAMFFCNIGAGLGERYMRTHDVDELRGAIRAYQQATERIPRNSPDRPECFNNLGVYLTEIYDNTDEITDLESAVRAC